MNPRSPFASKDRGRHRTYPMTSSTSKGWRWRGRSSNVNLRPTSTSWSFSSSFCTASERWPRGTCLSPLRITSWVISCHPTTPGKTTPSMRRISCRTSASPPKFLMFSSTGWTFSWISGKMNGAVGTPGDSWHLPDLSCFPQGQPHDARRLELNHRNHRLPGNCHPCYGGLVGVAGNLFLGHYGLRCYT